MPRQLAITKRVDLSDIAEGWDGCYITVVPASYQEVFDLDTAKNEAKTQIDIVKLGIQFAKSHFSSGQVMIYGDDGKLVSAPMQSDDLDLDREIVDRCVEAIIGAKPDPKVSSTVTA